MDDDRPLDSGGTLASGAAGPGSCDGKGRPTGRDRSVPALSDASWSEVAGPVRRFLRRIVGAERAEDLASDTMLSLLEYSARRRVRRPVSFALRVAWNKAVDLLRRREETRERRAPVALDDLPAIDRHRVLELREWLDSGLARLRPDERAVLHLRYDEGLAYRDIAVALGVPTGTVGRRLHEARRRLAEVLGAVDDGRGLSLVTAFLPGLRPGVTSLAEALGVSKTAAGTSAARSWWILAMSKKIALAAVLLVLGAGGFAWWLARSECAAPVPVVDRGPAPDRALVAQPPPDAPDRKPIAPRPFAGEERRQDVAPTLAGRVLDPDGRPVGGARVHVAARGASAGFDVDADPGESEHRRAAVSGADGGFVADVDGLSCAFDLAASAAGLAPAILEDVALSGPPIEIRLGRGIRVKGTVRDLSERPIGGARVTFRGLAGRGRIKSEATTDESGRFSLGPLPEASLLTLGMAHRADGPAMGEAHILVEAAGFASQRVGISGPAAAPPGSTESIDIHMARGGIVEGVVRSAVGGAPIGGAEVVVWTLEGMQGVRVEHGVLYRNPFGSRIVARGRTDAEGRYRIEHVPAPVGGIRLSSTSSLRLGSGRMKLGGVVACGGGFAPAGVDLGVPNADGEVQTVDLVLNQAAAVSGRVVDQEGAPVAGARVFCFETRKNAFGVGAPIGGLVPGETGVFGGCVLSDEDGRFRHAAVPVASPGGAPVVAYACSCDLGLPSSQAQAVDATGGPEVVLADLIIERRATLAIEGDVRDEQGGAIAGARIQWGVGTPMSSRSGAQSPLPVYSDRRGRFRMLVPRAGSEGERSNPLAKLTPRVDRALVVSARGRVSETVDPPAEGSRLCVTLKPARTITGVVVRPDGAVAGGAEIRLLPATLAAADSQVLWKAQPLATTRSDPSGRFVLDAGGDACILIAFVMGEGQAIGMAGPVTAPANDVRITIPAVRKQEGLTLRVRVVDAVTGKPWLAQMTGYAQRSAAEGIAKLSGMGSGRVESPGVLAFPGIAPDTYDLRVESPGIATWRIRNVVVDERSVAQPIEARLGAGATLDGLVLLTGASSLDGIEVTANGPGGQVVRTQTDARGAFRIQGVDAGRWELTASLLRMADHFTTAEPSVVEVGVSGAIPVQLPMVAAVKTTVIVTCARRDGPTDVSATRPLGGLWVRLEDAAGRALAGGSPEFADAVGTAALWSQPGPVKAVVRQGPRVLGSAAGVAGGEIRLSVTLD